MNYQQYQLFLVTNQIQQAIHMNLVFQRQTKIFFFFTLISLTVPLGNFSVSLCVMATTLTPILQRIPNDIRKPNELRNAVWYRTGIFLILLIIWKREGIYDPYFDAVAGIVLIRRWDIPSSSSTNSA